MTPYRAPIVLVLLVIAGAGLGYALGPALASADDSVRLASRVWREETQNLQEWTLESEAFRNTGESVDLLYERARAARGRYARGGVLLGAWLGLVVGAKLFCIWRPQRSEEYSVNQADCVACCRCFRSCPREQLRLKQLRGEAKQDATAPSAPEKR